MAGSDILYEDKHCKVKKGKLIIKWYYFPTGQSKTVDLDEIKGIYYDHQKLSEQIGIAKTWGMSLSPIWWASDIKRFFRSDQSKCQNVVVDVGSSIRKGFTVSDMNGFLAAVRPMLQYDVIIANNLPF